jgi:hypothetical protein
MSWVAVGVTAVKVISGHRAAKAGEALGEAKAKYENATRMSQNKLQGAETALANVAQSIANKRRLDAAGENLARGGEALARAQEAASANSFSRRVQAAEASGEAVASAAFAGVTGGSVQTLVETAALRTEAVEEVTGRQEEQAEYELRKNVAEQSAAGIAGLDQRLIRPNLDVGTSVNQAPKAGSLLDHAAPALLNLASSYFGAGGSFGFGKTKGYAGGKTNDSFFGGNRGSGD